MSFSPSSPPAPPWTPAASACTAVSPVFEESPVRSVCGSAAGHSAASGASPRAGQGTMALVQKRNSPSVYSLLPLPRYEQHSAQRPQVMKKGRPLRPADALARQLEGRCAGVAIAYLEIMSARRSRQQLAQWVSADCFHRLLPVLPEEPAPGAPGDAVDSPAGSAAGASAEGAR